MSNILNALERDLLEAFFALEGAQDFVLTGGAALTEFYFQHRLSNDLDLFTLNEQSFTVVATQLSYLARTVEAEEKPIRSLVTLNQVVYRRADNQVKLDIVRDSAPFFGEARLEGRVRIDSLENIGANKVMALFGRAAYRDYIDLYYILQNSNFTFKHLLKLAKQKDSGLQEFYLAGWIKQQTPKLQNPPILLKAIDLAELKTYFLKLADELMADLNPDEKLPE